jgi:formylglycine-generating enzyme required for sulfatase activity
MRRAIASLMLVVGVWVCPETAWGQITKRSNAGSVPSPPSGPKPQAPQVLTKQQFRKSIRVTPSQPIEGSDFEGSSLGLVRNPQGPFKWIPPGTFQMGSTEATDPDRSEDETPHMVTLTQGFWLLDHEVTQQEYRAIKGYNPSEWPDEPLIVKVYGLLRPVEQVTWDDAVDFCNKLTEKDRKAGRIAPNQEYRLPSEAEWEYACRAGTTTAVYYNIGDRNRELDAIAWWDGNVPKNWIGLGKTGPVKQHLPNAFGLYDMIGNVSEWCFDWYGDYPSGDVTDPKGPSSGSYRVGRGGSWSNVARRARSAFRFGFDPGIRRNFLGFRPALSSVRSAQ